MKTSVKMKHVTSQLAAKHGVNLKNLGAYLKLTQGSYVPLVATNVARNCISVFHLIVEGSTALYDPRIIFWVTPLSNEWVPAEVTQLGFAHRVYLKLDDDGEKIVAVNIKWQASLRACLRIR